MPTRPRSSAPRPSRRSLPTFPSVRVLGVRIDCLTVPDLLRFVRDAVSARARVTILYVNVHCMNVRERDADYARILEDAELVYCDGTGVRLAALLRGLPIPARMTGADWIHDLSRAAAREGLSLYLLGGQEGVAEAAAGRLQTAYPGLDIAGTDSGFSAGAAAVTQINAARPDILLLGMGTPAQERWIDRHRDDLDVSVVWAVGALFDFVSGRLPRGPRWMTDNGLEWLCRLAVEPRKLWRRYLLGNPQFFWRVLTRR